MIRKIRTRWAWFALGLLLMTTGCSNVDTLKTVEQVDLERFMGDWFVIASIPTFLEKGAHNAIESYALNEDGTIATTFTFREGALDGPEKSYHPKGFVKDRTGNAEWGMRFVWPIKADYRIVYLDDDYSVTVVGRNKRDFVWLMARDAHMSDEDYGEMLTMIGDMGYDTSQVKRVPQQW